MESYKYTPRYVCSREINFSIDEEGNLHQVRFTGGCDGNLKAIGKLIEGRNAADVAALLRGNDCGGRGTSCADQLSKAIDSVLNNT
jgi:uncharacterized protein (TIGR03905 family)